MSNANPGEADIDREILSEENPQFLLHDSQGFEQGEDKNFKIVEDFIKRREEETEIKNKLHAIWYARSQAIYDIYNCSIPGYASRFPL